MVEEGEEVLSFRPVRWVGIVIVVAVVIAVVAPDRWVVEDREMDSRKEIGEWQKGLVVVA